MKLDLIIPDSLAEITLKQYQKYLRFEKEAKDNDNFLRFKMLEIFCNLSPDLVRKIPLDQTDNILSEIKKIFEQKPQLVQSFTLGGVDYGFIPQLDDITFGEYIDLDTNIGDWDNMHVAMNVLYRPIKDRIGDKYTLQEYAPDQEAKLDEIPMDVVFGSIFFFYNLGIELSQAMMTYLEMGKEGLGLTQQQILAENGAGIRASMRSLKEILQGLKVSLSKESINAL